jgi:hypothetical protein
MALKPADPVAQRVPGDTFVFFVLAGQFSYWSQQHQPAMTRMPIWSARSKK